MTTAEAALQWTAGALLASGLIGSVIFAAILIIMKIWGKEDE